MESRIFVESGLSFAVAALGFAVLFNAPRRSLLPTVFIALCSGVIKQGLLHLGFNAPLTALMSAAIVGIFSIQAAHSFHAPNVIFSIPAIIPLVPGVYAYRMMIGLIQLVGDLDSEAYLRVLASTVKNGLSAAFITLALAVGVAAPMLVTRKNSGKFIRFD